ncbi:MAG: CDP-alcohol phosphatidyltransferase family protein [Candidatus Omnitrophica bacterium]|nr:CDP-alcohol phosphatidyltransferase family protein [Candidatus Omnitrophota bacterium]
MLRKAVYPKVEKLLKQIASFLHTKGFTPNQLTVAGLALNFIAGCFYAVGFLFLGGFTILIAALGDLLDGPLARTSNQVTKFGAFLDSTLDRYSDFFIFGGLALCFARQNEAGWFLVTLGIIAGAFVTSYSKARAENLIESCSVGYFERAERVILIALGTLLPFILPLVLWVLLLGTNITALQRILFVRKTLAAQEEKKSS